MTKLDKATLCFSYVAPCPPSAAEEEIALKADQIVGLFL